MTTSKPIHHVLAVLKLPRPVAALIAFARGLIEALTGNLAFPNPDPTLLILTGAVADLVGAETAAQAKTVGAVAVRNDKRAVLIKLLKQEMAYIQKIADADPAHAGALIQSARLSVRNPATRKKQVFAARPGEVSGSVRVVAESAGRRASYEWQYSTDGGKTWQLAPVTLQAKTVVTGLQPGSSVTFRYRSVTKTGEADWSQAITLVVR
jgi:hypothetical protein